MLGMEMMLAKMTGMTPEQMQAKVAEFQAFVSDGSKALLAIAETQRQILDKLEAIENGRGN